MNSLSRRRLLRRLLVTGGAFSGAPYYPGIVFSDARNSGYIVLISYI